MTKQDEVPGITLFLVEATRAPTRNPKLKGRGYIRLEADIADDPTWDHVVEKLDGLRIHTVANLAEAIVDAMKAQHAQEVQKLEERLREQEVELQKLRQELSFREPSDNLRQQEADSGVLHFEEAQDLLQRAAALSKRE
jgi:glutamyl-tRNA reductase